MMLALLAIATILWIAHLRWLHLGWTGYSWYRSCPIWMIVLVAGFVVGVAIALFATQEVLGWFTPAALGVLSAPVAAFVLAYAYWGLLTGACYVFFNWKLANVPDERRCPKCGYCLDGAPDIGGFLRCPECGVSSSVAQVEKLRGHRLLMAKLARLWKFEY